MRRLRIILCFILMLAVCPIFLACDEATLESIPWQPSANSEEDIIQMVDSRTEFMFSSSATSASIPVTYNTTITYKFHDTASGDFVEREIKDEIVLTMTRYKNETQPKASYTRTRYDDGQVVFEEKQVYSKNGPDMICYIDRTEYVGEEKEQKTSKGMTSDYADSEYFLDLVGEVIKYDTSGNASKVQTKSFENVTYFRLSISSANNANNLKTLFENNDDIFNTPSLFQMNDKVIDSISSMDYQYGLNDDRDGYLSYFAMNYSLSRYIEGTFGDRETYLDVNMVTKLDKKGDEIEEIEEIEDSGEYACANFLNIMNGETSQGIFRQEIDENKYNQITLAKKNGDTFIKIESYENGSLITGGSKLYSFIYEEDIKKLVTLNVEDRTYMVCEEETILPSIVDYDFATPLPNKVEEKYICGAGEDAFFMSLDADDRVQEIGRDSDEYIVVDYGTVLRTEFNIRLSSYTEKVGE